MAKDPLAPQADVWMSLTHNRVHNGLLFVVSNYDSDVDIAAPKYWHVLTVQDTYPHIQIAAAVSGAGLIELYQGGTVSDAGTALTAVNLNRNSSRTPDTLFYRDPTTTGDGSLLVAEYIPGGDRLQTRIGSQARRNSEWIFNAVAATRYFVKFTPDADNTKIAIEFEFYESSQGTP